MDRESRWILHALKHGWPIDNFELWSDDEVGENMRKLEQQLTEAVQQFQPRMKL